MKREFIEKMIEAKKCEAEAFLCLMPDSVRPHLKVIQSELGSMAKEWIFHQMTQEKGANGTSGTEEGSGQDRKKVRKVNLE